MNPNGESRLDRMERMMEFILEQQAQSETRWARNDEQWARADERQAKTDEQLAGLAASQAKADSQIAAIRKLVQIGMKMLVKQGERMDQLAAAQMETQTTLKSFIESLKKGSNGHN